MNDGKLRPLNEQTTYYGTLDDVVYRYPWGKEPEGQPLDLDALRSQLITAVIYDKAIIVNDGYLVANPLISPDLMNTASSLIGTMLKGSAAFLYSRNGEARLEEGIERTAASGQGVRSHAAIINDPRRWEDLKWGLKNLDHVARGQVLPWPADKNMGEVFYLLMKSVVNRPGSYTRTTVPDHMRADYDAVFREFEANLDDSYDAARTKWEEFSWRHFLGYDVDKDMEGTSNFTVEELRTYPVYDQVRVFMNIANEMYHLAQTAGAARSLELTPDHPLAVEQKNVGVATALIDDHEQLISSQWSQPDLAKHSALSQLMLSVPHELRFTGDFSFVERFRYDKIVYDERNHYLELLRDFANDECSFGDAEQARDSYAKRIADIMHGHVRGARSLRYAEQLFELLIGYATSPLDQLEAWLLGIGEDSLRNRLIERVAKARVETALRKEGIKSAQGGMEQTRNKGLYLGPLDKSGIDRLLENVSPHPKASASTRSIQHALKP